MTDSPLSARPHRFVLEDEERMVQDSARDFVADRLPIGQARELRDLASEDFDREVWGEMVGLGWPGIAIAETHGGAGLGVRALAAVIEEMGRTLGASPLASSALIAATTIGRFAADEAATRWLPALAAGEVIAALAVDEAAQPSQARPGASLAHQDGIATLTGTKRYVVDGAAAGLLLVSADDDGEEVLALVRADAPGVTVATHGSIDGRSLSDLQFAAAPVDAILRSQEARSPVAFARDCACIGLAAEMLGACSQALDLTLDYMRTRQQFGQAIGAFQALQHRAAALFIELELARSCVHAAVDALHHDDAALPLLSSLAKAAAGDLMRLMSYEMIQLHGGIGMTDAHDAGLYLKRGRVAALLHGDAAYHRARYAALKGY